MRSSSLNKQWAAGALALAVACGGCSTGAPPLPVDTTGVNRTTELKAADFSAEDRALSCEAILKERTGLRQAMEQANADIRVNGQNNQYATFFSAFLLPAILAAKSNEEEKNILVLAQARIDTLNQLHVFKKC